MAAVSGLTKSAISPQQGAKNPLQRCETLIDVVKGSLPTFSLRSTSLITAYACPYDTESLIDLFTEGLGLCPEEANDVVAHSECEECLKAKPSTAVGLRPLPATPASRLVYLANLYCNTLGVENDKILSFFSMFSFMEILEYDSEACLPELVCYDIIFHHEPWYNRTTSRKFEDHSADEVRDFLQKKGYTLTMRPARGQVVIYSHGNEAVHYARVESVERGVLTVIAKYGHDHVIRGRLEAVYASYGTDYMLLEPPVAFPALYTSPKTIRAGAK